MNQGKLDVVKQEMARVNTEILGISKLTQKDGCVRKKRKAFLIPLIFTVPSQQETLKAPWVSLATALDRAART